MSEKKTFSEKIKNTAKNAFFGGLLALAGLAIIGAKVVLPSKGD